MTSGIGRQLIHTVCAALLAACALGASTAEAQTNPTRLLVCEATDDSCLQPNPHYTATWSFNGTTGVVASPASESTTQLTIETLSQDKIDIRRVDGSGRAAIFCGTIHGNHVTVSVRSDSHPDAPAGSWSAEFQNLPAAAPSSAAASATDAPSPSIQGLPQRLIECEGNGPCNGAWTFDGASG